MRLNAKKNNSRKLYLDEIETYKKKITEYNNEINNIKKRLNLPDNYNPFDTNNENYSPEINELIQKISKAKQSMNVETVKLNSIK